MKYYVIIILLLGTGMVWWWHFIKPREDGLPVLEPTELTILEADGSPDQPRRPHPTAQPYAEVLNNVLNQIFTAPLTSQIPAPTEKLNRIAALAKSECGHKIISESAMNLVCTVCARLNNAYTERESCAHAYKAVKTQRYNSLKGGLTANQIQARHVQSVTDKWKKYVAKHQVAIRSDLATLQNLIRK